MQNKLAANPKLYSDVFGTLHSKKDKFFLKNQFDTLKTQSLPHSDLIGDTIYYKNKNYTYRIQIDFKNSHRLWVNGVEWNFDVKKDFAQNYNTLLNLMQKRSVHIKWIHEAVAQELPQESYPATIAYTFFTGFFYSQPDVYVPQSLDELTQAGFFSNSRYCVLNSNEKEKVEESNSSSEGSKYYKWLTQGVFPGYTKEFDSISENFLNDERAKNSEAYPNGIVTFTKLKSAYEETLESSELLDDSHSKDNFSFYNQMVGPMIESDLKYFSYLLGTINSEIAKALANNKSLKACDGKEGYLNCFLSNRSTAVRNNENYDKVDSLIQQRQCLGELLQRRQEFQRAYFQDFYCSKKNLAFDTNIERHPKEGIYDSTVQNCKAAVETRLIERPLLCAGKDSARLYDVQAKGFSTLIGAELCEDYMSPVCFRKNSNIATMVQCSSPGEKCACVPKTDRMNASRRLYHEKSGGSR